MEFYVVVLYHTKMLNVNHRYSSEAFHSWIQVSPAESLLCILENANFETLGYTLKFSKIELFKFTHFALIFRITSQHFPIAIMFFTLILFSISDFWVIPPSSASHWFYLWVLILNPLLQPQIDWNNKHEAVIMVIQTGSITSQTSSIINSGTTKIQIFFIVPVHSRSTF